MNRGKWSRELFARPILSFSVLIPVHHQTITTSCRESVEALVESDAIDSINYSFARLCLVFLSMALETEVKILALVLLLKIVVFDSNAAFNGAHCIAFTVSKHTNGGCRELKRRFGDLARIPSVGLEVFF